MLVRVETNSDVPVFQQVADQIKAAIARGAVRPGDAIPSVRKMASTALVNPNTVARAYRMLEREGVVYTRRGVAVFVSADAQALCCEDRTDAIRQKLAEAVDEARQTGMGEQDVRQALEDVLMQTAGAEMMDEEMMDAEMTDTEMPAETLTEPEADEMACYGEEGPEQP